jgi:hypothetical protein
MLDPYPETGRRAAAVMRDEVRDAGFPLTPTGLYQTGKIGA